MTNYKSLVLEHGKPHLENIDAEETLILFFFFNLGVRSKVQSDMSCRCDSLVINVNKAN